MTLLNYLRLRCLCLCFRLFFLFLLALLLFVLLLQLLFLNVKFTLSLRLRRFLVNFGSAEVTILQMHGTDVKEVLQVETLQLIACQHEFTADFSYLFVGSN